MADTPAFTTLIDLDDGRRYLLQHSGGSYFVARRVTEKHAHRIWMRLRKRLPPRPVDPAAPRSPQVPPRAQLLLSGVACFWPARHVSPSAPPGDRLTSTNSSGLTLVNGPCSAGVGDDSLSSHLLRVLHKRILTAQVIRILD
jgi:hypothetical protein